MRREKDCTIISCDAAQRASADCAIMDIVLFLWEFSSLLFG